VTTKVRPEEEQLTAIGSGGLTVMSASSDVTHDVEDSSDWRVRLVELAPGEFHAICHLDLSGSNSRTQTVVAAKLDGGAQLASDGEKLMDTLKRTFPASYLNHALYDTAASAARVALSLIASELKVSRITMVPRIEIVDYTEVSKEAESD
jgi:hypothetical protein